MGPPYPSANAIASVYASGYFHGSGAGYSSYFESERASNQRKADHRLLLLQKLGARPRQRLLDIGAADGTFVASAMAAGFDAYGVEVSDDAHDAAAAELRPRLLRNLEQASVLRPFDVVTSWDVLEHLPDVDGTVRQLSQLLQNGWSDGRRRACHRQLECTQRPAELGSVQTPEHLTYFSSRSLCTLLRRGSAPSCTKSQPGRATRDASALARNRTVDGAHCWPGSRIAHFVALPAWAP